MSAPPGVGKPSMPGFPGGSSPPIGGKRPPLSSSTSYGAARFLPTGIEGAQNFNQQALNLAGPAISASGQAGFQPNIPGTQMPAVDQSLATSGIAPHIVGDPTNAQLPPGYTPIVPGSPWTPPAFRVPTIPGGTTGGYATDAMRDEYGYGDPAAGQGGSYQRAATRPAFGFGGPPRRIR